MKNFQQNLLVILALALCGLCAWQWHGQTVQRAEIETLNRLVYDRNAAIQGHTNSIAMLNHQVIQMDARLTEMKAAAAANEDLVTSQKTEISRLQFENANFTNELAQYKAGVDALEAKLKEAYAGIDKQNATITNLISRRNEMVQKYNDEVKDRNDVVSKYNDLAKQVEKMQSGSKQ